MTTDLLVKARAVTKSFGVTKALISADLTLRRGEVHALLGGNGAGKSTLISIPTNATPADGGTLEFTTEKVAVVHQELAIRALRARAVALVRADKPVSRVAAELGISEGGLHNWGGQDRIGRGERPGLRTPESTELTKARKRILQLETEVAILKRAAKLLGEDRPDPKGSTR
jgi:transposase